MTLSSEKLLRKKVAAEGALTHLRIIEKQIDLLRTHISTRSGPGSGISALHRLESIHKSLVRNVTAEKLRIEKHLTARHGGEEEVQS